ncbi:hypothetical protein CPLU01_15924 [Colletotrichum plurivorum]|uniref:Uncharacterized protein n=1 Tax=Colletotrichum plurivorum TaxID=2175906 RepID=A0A8H6J542_9PEZI|nr:hypothetical protein CPLU01_15924 [Colletotrichum plurivorum]
MCVVCRRAARADAWTPRKLADDEGEEEAQRPGTSIPRRWKTVVQPAPSHDGSPTFAAYEVLEATAETEAELRPVRPAFGCVVYDTTHTAHPARSARLARALFERTEKTRRGDKSHDALDRIEVVTFPLPEAASDEERADACVRHYEREAQSRLVMPDRAEAISWDLPERFMDSRYSRMIVAINNFYADGNDDDEAPSWELSLFNPESLPISMEADESRYGSCMMIWWLPQKELSAEVKNPGYTAQKCVAWSGHIEFERTGAALAEATNEVAVFYIHYVGEGLPDRHLDKARSS